MRPVKNHGFKTIVFIGKIYLSKNMDLKPLIFIGNFEEALKGLVLPIGFIGIIGIPSVSLRDYTSSHADLSCKKPRRAVNGS